MALEVLSSKIMDFPSSIQQTGSESLDVTYRVTTNKAAPGTAIVHAAIEAGELPENRTSLNITHDSETYSDGNLFASRYRCESKFSDRVRHKYDITVSFETVQPGSSSAPRTSNPNLGISPLLRPVEKTVEWIQSEERVLVARNVDELGDREANTVGPIVNGAGEEVEVFRPVRLPVLVVRKNVSSWEESVDMDFNWRDTTNDRTWEGIAKGRAAFLSASIDGPSYWNDVTYYQLTVKVKVRKGLWTISVPNVGSTIVEENQKVAAEDGNGVLLDEVNLNTNGEKVDELEYIDYKHLDDKNYSDLITEINNYS